MLLPNQSLGYLCLLVCGAAIAGIGFLLRWTGKRMLKGGYGGTSAR